MQNCVKSSWPPRQVALTPGRTAPGLYHNMGAETKRDNGGNARNRDGRARYRFTMLNDLWTAGDES
jgi:hypothetical protein